MNIVFLGPPGSGKGTQSKRLEQERRLTHVSTGDAFRHAIKDNTPLGAEIKSFVDNGQLVPDELVSRVVFDELMKLKGKGFLLDGYPRTVDQAKALTTFSDKSGIQLDAVLFLDVPFTDLALRLSSRRTCPKCTAVYNVTHWPPKVDGICDICGTALVFRRDDHSSVVQQRFAVYMAQTEPILNYYRSKPFFWRIDGAQAFEKVYREIDAVLERISSRGGRS